MPAIDLHFNFPIATLTKEGDYIITAAETNAAALAERLAARGATFIADTRVLLGDVENAVSDQTSQTSDTDDLTAEQNTALGILNQHVIDAKKSAKKAFKGQDVKLRSEFQVGINKPQDLASILSRARIIRDASKDAANAAALAKVGWIAADTTALDDAIGTLGSKDTAQESQKNQGVQSTTDRNTDANSFYDALLAIQNAANLQFKANDPANTKVRADFRLDTFPPASNNPAKPAPTPAPATTPAKPPTP